MARFLVPFAIALSLFGCSKDSPEPGAAPGAPSSPAPSASAATTPPPAAKAPLRVAYSDWPGWTAFEVGIQKGWFKEAGVDVEFSWADYGATIDNFTAGKADAVMVTNGDALVTGANGAKSKMILLTDYSNGNDKVVGKPGIKSFKDLKGKKVGLELTLVEHLLFLKGCEKNGIDPKTVTLVGTKTNDTPQVLGTKQVDAIAAWYPVASQALAATPGALPLFTSADVPGLIYDSVAVNPTSLAQRHDDWVKFVKVWYKIADYVKDPKTQPDAVAIMAAKAGAKVEEYQAAMPGTYFFSLADAKEHYKKGPGLDSVYGSSSVADKFNVDNKVYKDAQSIDEYVDPSIVDSL